MRRCILGVDGPRPLGRLAGCVGGAAKWSAMFALFEMLGVSSLLSGVTGVGDLEIELALLGEVWKGERDGLPSLAAATSSKLKAVRDSEFSDCEELGDMDAGSDRGGRGTGRRTPLSGLRLELVLLGLSEDERITSRIRVRSASFLARLSVAPWRDASKDCCINGVIR